jgi:GntR family transcriptional regulator
VTVDPRSPAWPRHQVAAVLRERIASGELTGKLPSIVDLAREFGVAQMTVVQAVNILKAEGLIYGVRSRGLYVTEPGAGT